MFPNISEPGIKSPGGLKFSKIGLFSVAIFFLFSVAFRILLPFGDEPDFNVKAGAIKFGESINVMTFLPKTLIENLKVNSSCAVESGPFTLYSYIPSSGCSEPFGQVVLRLVVTAITFIPIFITVIFKKSLISFFYHRASLHSRAMANLRIDSMTVVLPFSGFVYYSGLLSNEQLTLMLSVLAFVFLDKALIIVAIMSVALVIDFGNAIVASFFFFTYYGVKFIYNQFGRRITQMVLLFIIATVSVLGVSVLMYLPADFGQIGDKASAMLWVMTEGSQADRIDKYPLVFRPILSGLSFVLYTPSYIKSPIAYIFVFFVAFYLIIVGITVKFRSNLSSDLEIQFLAFIFTILALTFAFPTYANGKYYIFMIPILFSYIVVRLGNVKAITLSATTTILVIVNLSLFRLG